MPFIPPKNKELHDKVSAAFDRSGEQNKKVRKSFHKWERFGRKITIEITCRPGIFAFNIRLTNPIRRRQNLAKRDGWRGKADARERS